jgi:hypothetical protein
MLIESAAESWRLAHVAPRFVARDREATLRFYAILGFQPTYDEDGFLILTRDSVSLHVNVYNEGGMRSVCWVGVENIRALYSACAGAGIVRHPIEEKSYGLTELTVCDPFGNLILLAEPTTKRNLQPQP